MRRLSMRRRLPVRRLRVRLASLRRLWLRRLWLLLPMGPLQHLLKPTPFKSSGQQRVIVAGLIPSGRPLILCLFAVLSHLQ
jgi:hypothetical protein